MTHSRGDALQLVGMNTRTGAAAAIGIPRDSWVDIPGHGHDKINASLYFGGPQLLGQTVGNLVGIQPDYVFVTRFPYFIAMVKRHRRHRRAATRAPSATTHLKPKGFEAGPDPPQRLRRDGVLADPPQPARAATSTAPPTSSGCCAASRPRSAPGPRRPGFIERGVLSVMAAPAHRPAAGRAVPARAGHGPGGARRRSPAASCRAGSATSAGPASCCRYVSQARACSATRPGRTPRSSTAEAPTTAGAAEWDEPGCDP